MRPAFPCCRRIGECNPRSCSPRVRSLRKRRKQLLPLQSRARACSFLYVALLDAEAHGLVHGLALQTPPGRPVRAESQSSPVSIGLAPDRSRLNTQVEFHGPKGIPSAALYGRTDRPLYSRIAE